MIRLKPQPTFKFTASIAVPGEQEPQAVVFTGKHQGQQALASWAEKAGTLQGQKLAAHVVSVLQGWEGVGAEDGSPVPFTAEACKDFLDAYPGAPSVVALAYITELSAARRKN